MAGGPGAAGERGRRCCGSRTSTTTPIATGENGYLRHGFREAFELGAISIAAPDLQKTGGLLEGRRIADFADTHYISVAPHCIASPIGTIAAAHVAAAIPNFLCLEWHGMSVPFWDDLALGWDGPVIDARAHRGARPARGWAWSSNLDVAREYARARRAVLRRVMRAAFYDDDGDIQVGEVETPEPGRARCACGSRSRA